MPEEPVPFGGAPFAELQNNNNPDTGALDTVVPVIEIGTIDPTDQNADYIGTDGSLSFYTDYMITNRFESDRHIYMLPISSPGGFNGSQAAFAQLASPTLLWIADWTASRYQTPPEIPDSASLDPNWILLDDHYEPAMLAMAADGQTRLYRISGTYVYGCRNPSTAPVNDIQFGRPPWMEDNAPNGREVPEQTLTQNLINIV